ncbi:MAG: hypothetical protein MUC93_09925 [Bacteroidales bacterium]|jgi:hypothetical protein|nr:hypothetical protein [Bacteroidales bacterium]
MKKIFGLLLFACLILTVNGQQIYFETGKVFSLFDYKNSDGTSLTDLKGTTQNSLGLGFRMSLFKSPCHISIGVSNNKYGATRSDPALGNYSEWDVSYLDLNLGVDYEFFKPEMKNIERYGFSVFVKGICATDFMLKGKQRLNSLVFDLSGVEEFDKPVIFLKGAVGVYYYITRSYVPFLQYSLGKSFLVGNYAGQEKLRFLTHSVSLGFSVNLIYKK